MVRRQSRHVLRGAAGQQVRGKVLLEMLLLPLLLLVLLLEKLLLVHQLVHSLEILPGFLLLLLKILLRLLLLLLLLLDLPVSSSCCCCCQSSCCSHALILTLHLCLKARVLRPHTPPSGIPWCMQP